MMTAEQRSYVRYLRLTLGDAMRKARDTVLPAELSLEQGYRWEDEETVTAMVAATDLEEVASAVGLGLSQMLEKYAVGFGKAEQDRLREGRRFLAEGVKILRQIDQTEMVRLEMVWLEGPGSAFNAGHEVYFLKRFTAALRVLRLAWSEFFYATQRPIVRRVEMSAKESARYYDPADPKYGEKVRAEAEAMAHKTKKLVEVYDDQQELLYLATGQGAEDDTAGAPAMTKAPRAGARLPASVDPKDALAIREMLVARPGTSLHDAAQAVGVELSPVVIPNHRPAEGAELKAIDYEQLRALWSWVF